MRLVSARCAQWKMVPIVTDARIRSRCVPTPTVSKRDLVRICDLWFDPHAAHNAVSSRWRFNSFNRRPHTYVCWTTCCPGFQRRTGHAIEISPDVYEISILSWLRLSRRQLPQRIHFGRRPHGYIYEWIIATNHSDVCGNNEALIVESIRSRWQSVVCQLCTAADRTTHEWLAVDRSTNGTPPGSTTGRTKRHAAFVFMRRRSGRWRHRRRWYQRKTNDVDEEADR